MVYAGYETDIPGAALTNMVANVFYETDASVPLKELFITVGDGLQRWMILSADQPTLVDQLGPGFSFNGQPMAYRQTLPDASGLSLVRVGCAGPFKVSAEFGQDSRPFSKIYVEIGGQLLVFNASAQSAQTTGTVAFAAVTAGTSAAFQARPNTTAWIDDTTFDAVAEPPARTGRLGARLTARRPEHIGTRVMI
jgi:hypothetical protein